MRIGIMLPVAEDPDSDRRITPYHELRQLALAAEEGGLDSVWAADHLLYQAPDEPLIGFWESWTLMTAIAEATNRVEVGHLVLAVPFRNPMLLAWMANTLDEISDQRFVLGLGSGWSELEFRAGDFNFDHRVGVFEDSLNVALPLLREGRVDYDGEFERAHAELRPPPRRDGGPPILIASKGPRMHRLAAENADRWNTAWYGLPMEPFYERRDGLHAACHKAERDPAEIEITVGLSVIDESTLGEDDDRTRLLLAQPEVIAEGFRAWQAEGVAEVICRLHPSTPDMVERVARAAQLVREDAAVQ